MNIAIDISPLLTDHKYRGIGFYTENLIKNLEKYDKENNYFKLAGKQELPKNISLVHHNNFDIFKRTLKLYKNVKNLVTIHDLTPLKFPQHFPAGLRGKINWLLQKQTLKKFDAVITDSESSKKDIAQMTGIPEGRIYVVYLAAVDDFQKLTSEKINKTKIRAKYDLPQKYILYVGDVNWNKNIAGLVKSFSHLKKDFPGLKLVLTGKAFVDMDLKEAKEINSLIRSLGLEREVLKLGFIPMEDMVCLYNLAKVYVQPSYYEGFGLPVLEAMSCGVPVVCSNQGSLPEIAGDAAILVNPYNISSIAKGIKIVLNYDTAQYHRAASKGLKQAKKFSWRKTVLETVKVYKNLL